MNACLSLSLSRRPQVFHGSLCPGPLKPTVRSSVQRACARTGSYPRPTILPDAYAMQCRCLTKPGRQGELFIVSAWRGREARRSELVRGPALAAIAREFGSPRLVVDHAEYAVAFAKGWGWAWVTTRAAFQCAGRTYARPRVGCVPVGRCDRKPTFGAGITLAAVAALEWLCGRVHLRPPAIDDSTSDWQLASQHCYSDDADAEDHFRRDSRSWVGVALLHLVTGPAAFGEWLRRLESAGAATPVWQILGRPRSNVSESTGANAASR